MVIDAKPKDLGLPTEAYVAVEEVHDVSQFYVVLDVLNQQGLFFPTIWEWYSFIKTEQIEIFYLIAFIIKINTE